MRSPWTLSLRGRRSRNKVSVGEPAEGSFAHVSSNIMSNDVVGYGLLVLYEPGMHCPGLHGLQQQPCVPSGFTFHKVVMLMRFDFTLKMFCKECLSSIDDEECSEMHYALWIAEFREPIDVWMLFAPLGYAWRFAWFNANNLPSTIVLFSIAVSCKGQCVVHWTCVLADVLQPEHGYLGLTLFHQLLVAIVNQLHVLNC